MRARNRRRPLGVRRPGDGARSYTRIGIVIARMRGRLRLIFRIASLVRLGTMKNISSSEYQTARRRRPKRRNRPKIRRGKALGLISATARRWAVPARVQLQAPEHPLPNVNRALDNRENSQRLCRWPWRRLGIEGVGQAASRRRGRGNRRRRWRLLLLLCRCRGRLRRLGCDGGCWISVCRRLRRRRWIWLVRRTRGVAPSLSQTMLFRARRGHR